MPLTKQQILHQEQSMNVNTTVAIPSTWAMLQEHFPAVMARYQSHAGDEQYDDARGEVASIMIEPDAVVFAPDDGPQALRLPRVSGSIAVIPVRGVIGQRAGWDVDVSTDSLVRAVADMTANPNVGATILDIDSPGGSVYGTPEAAARIREMAQQKPIYGLANSMAASAAYWLGSSATKLFMTPSGQVGSIGVWSAHIDVSKAWENFGVKWTLISAGKYKVEGNPFEPLGEEARAAMQAEVDDYYSMFVEAVAANRGEKVSTVRNGMGEGRVLMARQALAENMVDGVATMEQMLGSLVKQKAAGPRGSRLATARAKIAIMEVE
jgi:signal peptide peptidase SppA